MAFIDVPTAAKLLAQGEIVAIPTETVYGLAARIGDRLALEKIFVAKDRPFFDPLIVHVGSIEQAKSLVTTWPSLAQFLAERFWPGPLTLILQKNESVDNLITAGLPDVGIRWPQHAIAQQLLALVAEPLAAPSANKFGQTSPTLASHVEVEFSGTIPVVDGGACTVGIESTVVHIHKSGHWHLDILRPGGVSTADIQQALSDFNEDVKIGHRSSTAAPGQLREHYQPRLPLIIFDNSAALNQQVIKELAARFHTSELVWPLKLNSNAKIAARELYARLHSLSENKSGLITFHANANFYTPEWDAIRDRLIRAARHQLR